MKRTLPYWLLILISCTFIYLSCSKSNSGYSENHLGKVRQFFSVEIGTPPAVQKIVSTIADYETRFSFLDKFIEKNGYPIWNKAQIMTDASGASKEDTIVIIPMAKIGYDFVTSFLVCDVRPTKVLINFYRGDRYRSYPITNQTDKLSATFIASETMYLDFLAFNHSQFILTDSIIFNYPDVHLSKEKTRVLTIKKHDSPGFRESTYIYLTGSSCYDVWMPSSGDLVGVPPGGSIEYGHYETQCSAYAMWVQIFNDSPSGGDTGGWPSGDPPGGAGGGAQGINYNNGYFWNNDPCDPNGWQVPDGGNCVDGVIGWQPITTSISDEFTPDLPETDPDESWWNDNTTSFPPQTLPSWTNINTNYPKDASGNDMAATDVYNLIGGDILTMRNNDPQSFTNACAARVSRALNYSGIVIPNIPGQTFLGADNKYYFLGAAKLYNWMMKTFAAADKIVLNRSQGGSDGSLFQSQLAGNQGIFIMQPANPKAFGATGHATIYNGSGCVGGENHCYFKATGGVEKIVLFKLQ